MAGGILPALLWLWFWLREDRKHPEPYSLIALAFLAGVIAVPIVLPLERFVADTFLSSKNIEIVAANNVAAALLGIFLWAVIEEVFKFLATYMAVLRRKEFDEPVDAVIYMITVALGFAALENSLFLLNPLSSGDIIAGLITGNLRFVGATLLHVTSSAVIGIFIAFAFYKTRRQQRLYTLFGVILSIALHAVFNFSIIVSAGPRIFFTFATVWLAVVAVIFMFEKIKRIHPTRR